MFRRIALVLVLLLSSFEVLGRTQINNNTQTYSVVISNAVGTQNDFAPGLVGNTLVRMNNASLVTITGFANGVTGQRLTVINVGAGQVDFVYNSAGSATGNKMILPVSSMNMSLGAAGQGSAEFIYDGSGRWMMIGFQQGGSISFTPTITFNAASVGITYSTQSGGYYISGRTLFFSGTITLSAKGSSTGNAEIKGLPVSSTAIYGPTQILSFANMATVSTGVFGLVVPGTPTVTLETGGAASVAFITDVNFTNTTSIIFAGSYVVT